MVATDTWYGKKRDIMFSASHDGGDTWSEKYNLSNNAGVSREPRVDTSSDGVHVHVHGKTTLVAIMRYSTQEA